MASQLRCSPPKVTEINKCYTKIIRISRKEEAKRIQVDDTTVAYEYQVISSTIHGALIEQEADIPKQDALLMKNVQN